ncbi:DNA helicase Pif1-like protein [Artemisia annua]|uniref:DNA helicase Pif1-like protein n=1 Tax=Artemisia annua TaxID=35608 RepID=A0A2U1NN57_ARTAN|nr:DNA helicase Pif1-like protein [Artemisia annua]
MDKNKKEKNKRGQEQVVTEKQTNIKKQKRKTWNAGLEKKFIDTVVKLGGSQAATPKKIKEHMKEDDITILELKKHIETFRQKTNTVDSFVKTRKQPSFVDTQDWTQQMIYYFKERWEDKERVKTTTTHDIAKDINTKTHVQKDPNMNKPVPKKRRKTNNDIGDKTEGSKRQKYTPWTWEMNKKFIDIVLKLGGCEDATPSKIIQCMKDDNLKISEVQNQFKERCKSMQGTDNQTPAEHKGISKEYIDIGNPTQTCKSCKAKLWRAETKTKGLKEEDSFSMCCKKGEVEIPKMATPPKELLELYTGNDKIKRKADATVMIMGFDKSIE